MDLHNAGHSIPEIAKMTGVGFSTIYANLDEIAAKNGVTRESLLDTPHPNYSRRGKSKMTIYRLKGKMLHEMVKRGSTKADFCAKYQCTEDELIAQIRKIMCDDARATSEILNEITVNEKRAGRSKSKSPDNPAGDAQLAPDSAVKDTAEEVPAANIQPEDEPISTEQQREKRIVELNAKKQELMNKAQEAAKRYAEADKGYGKCCAKLKEMENAIKLLEERLSNYKTDLDGIILSQNMFAKQRAEAKEEREVLALQIADTSLAISELLAVQLIACEDGNIESVDATDFVMNEDGADKYYAMLVHDPRCSDFRMKDIKLLARAMAIRENSKERRVIVTFEDECLTHFFAET